MHLKSAKETDNTAELGALAEYIRCASRLPGVKKIILFGSRAKGTARADSDVDLAVFFDSGKDCYLEEYRALIRLSHGMDVDMQVQAFDIRELEEPCGIMEEILRYGIEIPLAAERHDGGS